MVNRSSRGAERVLETMTRVLGKDHPRTDLNGGRDCDPAVAITDFCGDAARPPLQQYGQAVGFHGARDRRSPAFLLGSHPSTR